MLSEQEQREIDHELKKVPYKRGAAVDALQIVQKHRGYISDETLLVIAQYLEMSPSELDSVATFYNRIFRKPVGKHVVKVCDSISCYIMGYDKLRETVQKHLSVEMGQTTKDGNFTLITTQCLGCCDKAPALMVNDDLHQNLDEKRVVDVLDRYKNGKTAD